MPDNNIDEEYNRYLEDPRIPCQYGVKCYQKNSLHQKKYKHPPRDDQKNKQGVKKIVTGQKRKADNDSDLPNTPPGSPQVKHIEKKNEKEVPVPECSSSPEKETEKVDHSKTSNSGVSEKGSEGHSRDELSPSPEKEIETPGSEILEEGLKTENSTPRDNRQIISKLFLIEMPQDFYQFYDFCKENSKTDPTLTFKIVDLKLVGCFDVLTGKLSEIEDKDKCLRHWRYYYDPPEFQTVLKGNDKDGLHFGYWRDDPREMPIFVAKNNANVSCKIVPVAENLFGALDSYLEERTKLANPFEKTTIARLHQKLKTFAKERNINLEKRTRRMKERERKVVARTFHGAGIVVPYDRKTQVGYRKIAATDDELKKILKKIGEAESDQEIKSAISDLQEIIRWATIAADECDFGTCLELGHDLFSSGVTQVHDMTLQMLSIAYGQLGRSDFLKIAEVHLKDRKKGSSLSVL